jgi:hypothetical protein
VIMNDFCLSSAQFCYVIINVRNLECCMHTSISNQCVSLDSYVTSDGESVSMSWCRTHSGLVTRHYFLVLGSHLEPMTRCLFSVKSESKLYYDRQ